ncbi:myoneurin [Hyperolius riggenbachi]|uniref:myoneurin n=1 Tax=Hyperolius riggenbachi TaxID=752182 RepID=UPI0035A26A03
MTQSEHCKKLLDELNTQRKAEFLCDCTILLGDVQYKAHRNVLASFSEYFRALFHRSSDSTVHLDKKLATPVGFQKMLDFFYSGDLNFDRCDIEEICLAAEYLRVDEALSICKPKMVTTVCVLQTPVTKHCQDTHEDIAVLHPQNASNTETIPITHLDKNASNKIPTRSKKWKRTLQTYKKCFKKSTEQQAPASFTPPALSTDTNKMADILAKHPLHVKENHLASATAALSCESFTKQDSMAQSTLGKGKCMQSKQNNRLKEHSITNITSASGDVHRIEGMVKETAQTLFRNKPTCNMCGKIFSEASSLRRHMRIHKGVKPYVCHLCGKAFTQCNQLKTHVRTHTGEKPYQCKLCDKGFVQKCQLIFHRRMHHGEEKPYKCDLCNLQFATSSNLKIHVRKHSGEKPYVCDRCGQKFAQASTLTYHVRRHTGEKPYVCDTCGKSFAVSSSLITHARKHSGEKPYICGVCGKSFISSGELNKHFRSHTGERPFICEVCGNSYTDIKNLKKHKLKMHNGNEGTKELKSMDGKVSMVVTDKQSPKSDNLHLKPSELILPLARHIDSEEHQVLLPVTNYQCPPSEALLKTSVTNCSKPQLIFLQQMY